MKQLWLAAAAVLALGACGERGGDAPPAQPAAPAAPAASAAPAPAAQPVITPEGYGPVRIGMSQTEALAALGPGWRVESYADEGTPPADVCAHLVTGDEEGGGPLAVMVIGGRVTRVSLDSMGGTATSPIRTDRGLGIGSTEAQVRAAYPQGLAAEPHHYLGPGARYLTIWSGRPAPAEGQYVEDRNARGIRYVTDEQGVVQEIHAGDDTIQLVEGCS